MPKPGDERVELTLARISQEFIQNSLKYSGCTEIKIEVKHSDQALEIFYSDNGKGIVPGKPAGYDSKSGSGMLTISNRAALIGATCEWLSENGTQLRIALPLLK
jgi:signal transduction histidine kinase